MLIYFFFAFIWLLPTRESMAQTPVPEVDKVEIAQVDNSAYPEVTIYVRVTDMYGERVNDLKQENFDITEGGTQVEVSGFSGVNYEPIRTILVIDKSGSMQYEDKLAGAKQAALTFIDQMRPQDQAALIAFDNGVNLLQDFTSEHAALKSHIEAIAIGDCTSWYEAIYFASDISAQLAGRKSLILLSDGIDCREDYWNHNVLGYGSYHSFEEALDKAQKAETPVNCIALGREPAAEFGPEGYDEGRLTRMAEGTGGQYHHKPTADQLVELYRSLAMQTQEEYVLTYRSPRPTYDGTRRNIQVSVVAGLADGESGAVTGSETYVEQHLVTVESDWRVAALCLLPLLLAAIVPLGYFALRGRGAKGRGGRMPAVAMPPPEYPPAPLDATQPEYTPPAPAPPPSAYYPPPQPAAPQALACSRCGNPLRPGAKFCPACGQATRPSPPPVQPFGEMKGCPNCGQSVRVEARFCQRCGYRF